MRFITLLLLVLPLLASAQVSFDFESGTCDGWTFPVEGRWLADATNSIAGNYSLHHSYDNPDSGFDLASFPVLGLCPECGETVWEFRIMHAYTPSSINNWGFCLLSSESSGIAQPGSGSGAYFVGVNLEGSDDTLRLWKDFDGSLSVLVSTNLDWQEAIGTDKAAHIRVSRNAEGNWRLWLLDEMDSASLIGEAYDSQLFKANYAGIYYSYSSTKDQLLWVDDIILNGEFVQDNTPPAVSEADFASNTSVILCLDESFSALMLSVENYLLEPAGQKPHSVSVLPGNRLRLDFSDPLQNKTGYSLKIDTLMDLAGNVSAAVSVDLMLSYPEPGDIIISEFMPDPYPPVELGSEYIEIFNRSEYTINISSLSLICGTSELRLPAYKLKGGESLAFCDKEDTGVFDSSDNITGLDAFPVLNNNSGMLLLVDTLSYTIHGIEYSEGWGNDQLKSEGGWSLEIIDTAYPFSGSENWEYSINRRGGTPGTANSVSASNIDIRMPEVSAIFPADNRTVNIIFSEPVSGILEAGTDELIQNIAIESIVKKDSLWRSYILKLADSLAHGKIYTALLGGVRDFAGNPLYHCCPDFGLTEQTLPGDIVINEVLFDAIIPEEEYFELYNSSGKILDIYDLQAVSLNLQGGDTGRPVLLSESSRCFMPGSYFAFTLSKESVLSRYFSSERTCIVEAPRMPVLYSDRGSLLLYSRSLSLIDEATYSKDFHFDLISGTKGVSLERIDPGEPGNIRYNWHSASGMVGWGTPGMVNSAAFNEENIESEDLVFSSSRISPDGDGFEDILKVSFNPGEGTSIVDVLIYSDSGIPVNRLISNYIAYGSSSFYWNGLDHYGNALPDGLYIVFVRSRGEAGRLKHWKKVCALVRY